MKARLFPTAAALLVSLCPAVMAGDIRIQKDLPFLGDGRTEKMDAYLPAEDRFPGADPVVIWIHGGGWVGGSKSAKRELNVCRTLAENGYAAFSIDYHVADKEAGPEDAPWPRNIHDCKTALRFIRQEAARFGIDPARVAVSGGSAGAHLALCLGLTADDAELNKGGLYMDQRNDITCIIDFYGPTEIDAKRAPRFAGKTAEETAENIRKGSPVAMVRKDSPPILVVHGTKDALCDISHSRALVEKMKAAGARYEYVEVEGGVHSFDLQPKQQDLRPVVLGFLGKWMR
ncbi:MAG: alpha/beta hydrolase [Verrucomicrobiaceae bacterium]|nr:MAG: alpha/beta hydrolase [Verrucomicrobiaceae bacterium]